MPTMSRRADDRPGGPGATPPPRRRYVPAVGPNLKKVLFVVFGLFALLAVNSTYLLGITVLESATGLVYQNWFYLLMFALHLALGALILLPVVLFGIFHWRNAHTRPNRRAVRVGVALFVTALVLLASGILLTRIEGLIEVKDPRLRTVAYWAHVATPFVAAWLFVLHRLAGRRLKWRVGVRWAAVAGVFAFGMVLVHAQDPRRWNVAGPEEGERYFFPSLARTASGNFIPAEVLMDGQLCAECHADVHATWSNSVHRFSSFNNPPYLFSVTETRQVSMQRTGDVRAARFCAGCHDPVPFFSGKFDDPSFDMKDDPTAHAGITCTSCHAITHLNSVRGNSDYTIDEPLHYPFTFSENERLRELSRQLIKAKPEFHKKTFLKPFHKTAEFCGTCHKVHLPPELNDYKFLRGQNHYDTFLLSGASGHGVASFYYPERAFPSCASCHMEPMPSDDFGAKSYPGYPGLTIRDHMFPSANTGIAHLVGLDESVIAAHERFNERTARVDLFGVREGGVVDAPLVAPIGPEVPVLVPGRTYLLETVVRTLRMGHPLTQGTADSNELWLDVRVSSGERVVGRSGGYGPGREVDPWSKFFNVFMLDREGFRIDRRNPQDIFVPLYNHQIPPGAAATVHYRLDLPRDVRDELTVEVELRYRKFDTTYMRHVFGPDYENDLPVMVLARDRVVFPVAGGAPPAAAERETLPLWERWNDYGIGLLRSGEYRQAEEAFARVEALGRPDGPLNLARSFIEQGRVGEDAVAALSRAARFDPPAPAWSIAWFTSLVNFENGFLDEAIADLRGILAADDSALRRRGFDFRRDYRVLNRLGQALFERAKRERGRDAERLRALLAEAAQTFERTLALDPENVEAHFNLSLVYAQLGDAERAKRHRDEHARYKPDENASDRAIALARGRYPAADQAANRIVIYDLRRPGAYELDALAAPGPVRTAALAP
jgi:tetratricopeptide (TPR) repeat protein